MGDFMKKETRKDVKSVNGVSISVIGVVEK